MIINQGCLKRTCCVSMLSIITACSVNTVKDEDSEFYAVPVGSKLILNQDATIRGGQVAIYVQNGEILRYKEVNKYHPNCKFEIYTISEQPRSVQADTFEIIKVVDEIESSSLQNNVQLAALDNMAINIVALGLLDHSQMFNYATMLYLSSDQQKDVYRMTCQHWEDVRDDRHLSISQMRQAMGEIFTLKIKEKD